MLFSGSWMKKDEFGPWCFVSDPAPLWSPPPLNRCLDYDGQFRVTAGANCLIKFSYDGAFLRESGTGRVICAGSLTSGSVAYLATSCTHSVHFAYAKKGGSSVCVSSSSLCLINSATPGTVITFQDTGSSLLTYLYKGTVDIGSFWTMPSCQQNYTKSMLSPQTLSKTFLIVSIVSADGLALLGVWTCRQSHNQICVPFINVQHRHLQFLLMGRRFLICISIAWWL